ncbi:hypothetical protein ACP4OV_022026 [Aristida adscensionis]
MAAVDRLSSLPDDLLRRVLSFLPAREGAATAALSRRWGAIWRTAGAVNLVATDLQVLHDPGGFLRAAEAASRRSPPRTPTATPASRNSRSTPPRPTYGFELRFFFNYRDSTSNMVDDVLSNPAARRVEKLRLLVDAGDWPLANFGGGIYRLSFAALPSATLRRLHVVNCGNLGRPPAPACVAFPRLEPVRLEGCRAPVVELQRVIDAASRLAALHLEHCCLVYGIGTRNPCLQCPSVRAFEGRLVGDARRPVNPVSLKNSPAVTSLIRVDLHLGGHEHGENKTRKLFWQLVRNFSVTRVLKVKLEFGMEHIAIVDDKDRDEILCTDLLSNLERLELEGRYDPSNKIGAMAIANFLHCCPVLRDLRLKVTKDASDDLMTIASPLQQHQLDLDKSIDHFQRRRRSMTPLGKEDEDLEIPDIPCLSEHSFDCLQSYLRRVSLQFWMEEQNCLGIQLAKFFAENAMVLEEMHIADGNHKMCEHINRRIERWAARSSKRRNSPTRFIVQPGEM